MEIFIALAAAVGINAGVIAGSTAYFKRLFIAEERFHVLTEGGQTRVVAGKRRVPMRISDAEAHLQLVRSLSRRAGWNWLSSYWKLFGPARARQVDSELDKVRETALKSQRNKLLIDAMKKGYENDPVMELIMRAHTDEAFSLLRKAIAAGSANTKLELGGLAAKVLTEEEKISEIVLMDFSRRASLVSQPGGGVRLPIGYSWGIELERKGSEFEKIRVSLFGEDGRTLAHDHFYTSSYPAEGAQRAKAIQIQRALASRAHSTQHPSGIAPTVRALAS